MKKIKFKRKLRKIGSSQYMLFKSRELLKSNIDEKKTIEIDAKQR